MKQDKRLEAMKVDLFIRAIEYARLALFASRLENGQWVTMNAMDADDLARRELENLGLYAIQIVREMSIVPGERQALTVAEQAALRKKG